MVDSIDPSKLGYTDDEKNHLSQPDGLVKIPWNLLTQTLGAEAGATIAADSQDLPRCYHTTSWDREVLDTPLAIVETYRPSRRGFSRVETMSKKRCPLNDRVGTSYLEKEYENVASRKTQWKRNSPKTKMATWRKWSTFLKRGQRKISDSRLIWISKGVEDILRSAFGAELPALDLGLTRKSSCRSSRAQIQKVLAMAGIKHQAGSQDLSADIFGNSLRLRSGSVVKDDPWLLDGKWSHSGIANLTDQPPVFAGSAPINSWFLPNFGSMFINAVKTWNTLLIPIWSNCPLRWWERHAPAWYKWIK